ncbi:MAG: Na(+)/H(+) antiporter subunit B [Alphaproteobacteria bacterium]
MKHHRVLRIISKMLIPYIMLFALYVQFHGDFGPGGGFQAGVILASALILYGLIFGIDAAADVMPGWVLIRIIAAGVLIYGGVGVATMMMGGEYLNYSVLAAEQVAGQHLGILVIEFGVGTTVAAAMVGIFFAFAQRGSEDDD